MKGEGMTVEAWETEDGDVIVWGTHDPAEAKGAFDRYCEEVGADFDEDSMPEFQYYSTYWPHPAAIDIEDEPWPRSFVGKEPISGWVPIMGIAGR